MVAFIEGCLYTIFLSIVVSTEWEFTSTSILCLPFLEEQPV